MGQIITLIELGNNSNPAQVAENKAEYKEMYLKHMDGIKKDATEIVLKGMSERLYN